MADLQSFTLSDFLEKEYDFRFVIDPILVEGGVGMLYGKRGIGKTQLALTIMDEVSKGGRLFGKYECEPGPVFLVEADMAPVELQERLVQASSVLERPEAFHLAVSSGPIDSIGIYLDLMAEKEPPAWVQGLRATEPRLVVVDSLRKVHRLDENSAETPSMVYGAWREIVGPKPALLFLHHDKKSQIGWKDLNPEEAFRGSGAWLDDADTGMHFVRTRDGLKLYYSKLRSCAPQRPTLLEMNQKNLLLDVRTETSVDLAKRLLAKNAALEKSDLVEQLKLAGVSQAQAYRAAAEALEAGVSK